MTDKLIKALEALEIYANEQNWTSVNAVPRVLTLDTGGDNPEYIAGAEVAKQALADIAALADPQPSACEWLSEGEDYPVWETACGKSFDFENEGPTANGCKFCCFCGRTLIETLSPPPADTQTVDGEGL